MEWAGVWKKNMINDGTQKAIRGQDEEKKESMTDEPEPDWISNLNRLMQIANPSWSSFAVRQAPPKCGDGQSRQPDLTAILAGRI